jgi:hypothetical protein
MEHLHIGAGGGEIGDYEFSNISDYFVFGDWMRRGGKGEKETIDPKSDSRPDTGICDSRLGTRDMEEGDHGDLAENTLGPSSGRSMDDSRRSGV